jgi:predicted secreted protein
MRLIKIVNRRRFLGGIPLLSLTAGLSGRRALAGRFEGKRFDERVIDNFPAFDDARSRKVIFVAHCFLNQNARCNGSGVTPSAIPRIPELLMGRRIGIIQMPCPELGCLGLGREGLIYDQLSAYGNRRYLKALARDVAYQTRQYLKHDFRVLGILGINCSPSCGVDCHAYNGAKPGKGAFMEELTEELRADGLDIPLVGVADEAVEKAIPKIERLDG